MFLVSQLYDDHFNTLTVWSAQRGPQQCSKCSWQQPNQVLIKNFKKRKIGMCPLFRLHSSQQPLTSFLWVRLWEKKRNNDVCLAGWWRLIGWANRPLTNYQSLETLPPVTQGGNWYNFNTDGKVELGKMFDGDGLKCVITQNPWM